MFFEYYNLAYITQIQKIYVETVFCGFSDLQDIWKIYGYMPGYLIS